MIKMPAVDLLTGLQLPPNCPKALSESSWRCPTVPVVLYRGFSLGLLLEYYLTLLSLSSTDLLGFIWFDICLTITMLCLLHDFVFQRNPCRIRLFLELPKVT